MRNENKMSTPYVWANLRKCKACWICANTCPKRVIGKTGFLWHRHIVMENGADCTGCRMCIRVCPYGVFKDV
ncbi:MAG: 4Fe-4S binding protein [Tannerellaceae bacterium]|nr:4Fe-4S binding protein [Tannerellaceae bacterium]